MEKPPTSAEGIFAEALELPPGDARERLLAQRCAGDTALHGEVASLLRAHDGAGDFLKPAPPRTTVRVESNASASQGTAVLNAAVHAEVFLRAFSQPDTTQIENFVAQLPEALRSEARERIKAGLHVRRLRGQERRPPSEQEEELPRLPGFRIERKLGHGGLGVVYAAHYDKLNRRVV